MTEEKKALGAQEWIAQTEPASGWSVGRFLQTIREEGLTDALAECLEAYAASLADSPSPAPINATDLARRFHTLYEALAPKFGYETRKESAKPWSQVPEKNKELMTAVCQQIIADYKLGAASPSGTTATEAQYKALAEAVAPTELTPHSSVVHTDLKVRCHDCGGHQIWRYLEDEDTIEVFHDCTGGKKGN